MRSTLLAACLASLAAGSGVRPGRTSDETEAALDPLVAALVRQSVHDDRKHQSPFFVTLEAIARKNKKDLSDYIPGDGFTSCGEGRAARVGPAPRPYVLVVLRLVSHVIPGTETQQLLLLDGRGRVLDRLSCDISNRLTQSVKDADSFRTDFLREPTGDGAEAVVRYAPADGGRLEGGWHHVLRQEGRWPQPFSWDRKVYPGKAMPDWSTMGLCRVAVRGGKFKVVFPELADSLRGK